MISIAKNTVSVAEFDKLGGTVSLTQRFRAFSAFLSVPSET
jgi:hypothetical protein